MSSDTHSMPLLQCLDGAKMEMNNVRSATQQIMRKSIKKNIRNDSNRILMDEFFGVNVGQCKASIPDVKKVAKWIRYYSEWPWLEPEKGQYRFSDALGTIDYDSYYITKI